MKKLFHPYVSFLSKLYVLQVLCGNYIAEGKWTKQFEYEFSKKFNLSLNMLATSSGTSALEIAYDIVGIKEGDKVITTPLTCIATNVGLARRKAKIVFADIDESLNMNPADVRKKITKNTKAIVFVHFGGSNNNLSEILQIAKRYNVPVIEDAAQAIGSDYWGQADLTCVSFDAIKNLTTGDGGGIICKNLEDYQKAYKLRWYGFDRAKFQKGNSQLEIAGYKANMNNISAAIGLGNLRSFDKIISYRKRLQEEYDKHGIRSGIWTAYVITPNRDKVMEELRLAGFESGVHHYRNDVYEIFGGKKQDLLFMNKVENQYLLLPLHHNVSVKNVKEICEIVNFYR
jgi:perosamine synthetase